MRSPGDRLRRLAARVCEPQTIDRLVDPILSDIRHELHASSATPLSRRCWIVLRAYSSFWKALCVHGGMTAMGRTADERHALAAAWARLLWPAIAMTVAGTAFMIAVPAMATASQLWHDDARILVYLVPQALPIAVSLGILWGALWGAGRAPAAVGTRRMILAAGIAGTLVTFSTVTWLLPDANQAFRETIYSKYGRPPSRGANELGWKDLRRELAHSPDSVRLRYVWNGRIAVTCTPLIFGAILPLLLTRGRRRTIVQAVVSVAAYGAGFVLVDWETASRMASMLTPALAAWIPTMTAIAGAGMFTLGRDRARRAAPATLV